MSSSETGKPANVPTQPKAKPLPKWSSLILIGALFGVALPLLSPVAIPRLADYFGTISTVWGISALVVLNSTRRGFWGFVVGMLGMTLGLGFAIALLMALGRV